MTNTNKLGITLVLLVCLAMIVATCSHIYQIVNISANDDVCAKVATKRGFKDCAHMSRHDRATEFTQAHRLETVTCGYRGNCSATLKSTPLVFYCDESSCTFQLVDSD